MDNLHQISLYLLKALTHKVRTPLSTIKNDVEYFKSAYPKEDFSSTQRAIDKIDASLNDAFFMLNFQDEKEQNLNLFSDSDIKKIANFENINENAFVTIKKQAFLKLLECIGKTFCSLNLSDTPIVTFNAFLDKNTNNLKALFFSCDNVKGKAPKECSCFYEYINKQNDIDSILAIICDILITNLNLELKITSKDEKAFFEIIGF